MAETGNSIRVRLVTPERVLVDEMADAVEIPSKSGYMEVLYGHAPVLSELGAGHVRLHGGQRDEPDFFVVTPGFCEVLPDRVTILTASAIKPGEIDAGEAQSELERGQKMWSEAGEDAAQYERANEMIHEAETKLASAKGSLF